MAESKQNYVASPSMAEGTTYPVKSNITELSFPDVSGYTQVNVTIGGTAFGPYNLGKVVSISPGQPVPKEGSTTLLSVVSQIVGVEETGSQYLFYQDAADGKSKDYYSSPNSNGSPSTFIGNVSNTSTDPNKTTLKAVFSQPVDTDPVIIIGDMIIDPPLGDSN